MEKTTFTIGCFALIFDEQQRVLLCHRRDHDAWNLPGGGLECGEVPWECVLREAREETGLEVEIVRLVGVYAKPQKNEIVFSFLCRVVGGQIKLNKEADQISYFPVSALPPNTLLKQVERIQDGLAAPQSVLLKTQSDSTPDA